MMDDEDDGQDLRSALAEAMQDTPEEPSSTRQQEPVDASAEKPSSDRARGPDGKFAPKPDQPAPVAEKTQNPTPVAPQETAQAATPSGAPQTWNADTKQVWSTLPPAIQEQVLKREREISQALDQSAGARRAVQQLEQIVAPHQQMLARNGTNVMQAVDQLLQFHQLFEQNPAQLIAHLQQVAAQRQNRPPQQAQPQPQQFDPNHVQQLVDRSVEQRLQTQAIQSDIASFAKANPHFEALKPAMAALLQSGQANDLQDAYDKAQWMNPDIRSALIAERAAPAAAQAQQDRGRQAVAKAKAASGSIRGAPGGATPSQGERSLREELAAHFG